MKNETYNGYKNYETWNVALWINNEECLYRDLVEYVRRCRKHNHKPTYTGFIRFACLAFTDDGVSYHNSRISRRELTDVLFDGIE